MKMTTRTIPTLGGPMQSPFNEHALPERLAIFLPAATSPGVRARSEPAISTRLRRPAPSQCVFKAHRRGPAATTRAWFFHRGF